MKQNFENYLTSIFINILKDIVSIKWEHTKMAKEKSDNKRFIRYNEIAAQMDKLASWVKWYLPKTHIHLKPQNVCDFVTSL